MYFPLRVHSHYSLLLSTLRTDDLTNAIEQHKYPAMGITDFNSVSGCVEFYKNCKEIGIKPILGCELVVSESPEKACSTLTLICKNRKAWTSLLQIISLANDQENFKKVPTLSLEKLKQYDLTNFIIVDGYDGSLLAYEIFEDMKSAYFKDDYDDLGQNCLNRDWEEKGLYHISEMIKICPDYYLECVVEECCSQTNPLPLLLSNCVSSLAEKANIPVLIDNPVYYLDNLGAVDQRVLLCSGLKCTISKLANKIERGGLLENRLNIFLKSTFFKFHDLPVSKHEEIFNKCEDFDILSQPKLPKFTCPDGQTELEYLTHLCREGWKNVLKPSGVLTSKEKENEYRDRVLFELGVIEKAKLSGYFLIMQDCINEFRKRGYLIGPGRGSVNGSLVAFLVGITLIDPIIFNLSFNRFFDSSRIVEGKVTLPDIDTDFPPESREEVIAFLEERYDKDKVCQLATYGRLQGKSALKEVLRVNEYCSNDQMNIITSFLPSESSISDQLEEMEDSSIIRWALENETNKLKDYCYIEDGELKGDYSKAFAQAIRLSGINKNLGRHASAVIIANETLSNFCPIVKSSRSSERLIGFDMYSAEDAGTCKVDVLGLGTLSRVLHTCLEVD